MGHAFESHAQHGEGHLDLDKSRKRAAQVGQHQGVAGDIGDFVDAAGEREAAVAMNRRGGLLQFFKRFDGADNGAMLVVNGHGADADRDFVSGFVVQEPDGLGGMRSFDGAGDGTIFFAEFATGLIAVQQGF